MMSMKEALSMCRTRPGRLQVVKLGGRIFAVVDTIAGREVTRGSEEACNRAARLAGSQLELFPDDTGRVCRTVPVREMAHA